MPTTKLSLPLIDGSNTADVVRDFNALANAVDNKAGASDGLATLGADGKVPASQLNVSAPADASTSTKGVVQLSNETTSTSEVLAATPKAVKDAKDGLSAQIGILSALNTTNKADLVGATNEVNSKTGTLSSLNTTDKTSLVNAVNELFTFANDGKTKWSSVIGSPLVSSDTFTQMQTKTQTIKNTLATNLTTKGQSSVGTETLTALVNKVANVNTGFGKATGTFTASQFGTTTINNLTFTPSFVIVKNSNKDDGLGIFILDNTGLIQNVTKVLTTPHTNNGLVSILRSGFSVDIIPNGFKHYAYFSGQHSFIAIE